MRTSKVAALAALLVGAALATGVPIAIRAGFIPTGIAGEWQWARINAIPAAGDVALAASALAGYAGLAALGARSLARRTSTRRECAWAAALVAGGVAAQWGMLVGAPEAYGPAKWAFALHYRGPSGYFSVARGEIGDARAFLADYPAWIKRQDSLHIGTHPPGLFVASHAALRLMAARPGLARAVAGHLPGPIDSAFRLIGQPGPLPIGERAAIVAMAALTMLACASTSAALFALGRASMPAPAAWSAAALWPVVPSAVLFGPAADTGFALPSTAALALAAWACRAGTAPRAGLALAAGSGLVLASGMAFSLAFLPVGLAVAWVMISADSMPTGRRAALILATGVGFLAPTLLVWASTTASPFAIWLANARNHARFYEIFPRSYAAWVVANPLETAVALGLPATVWAVAALGKPGSIPRPAWATLAVLILLNFSGRNLSEVARLWLPLMPPLLLASGSALARLGGPGALAATIGLMGLQTLLLESTIQVVYPL